MNQNVNYDSTIPLYVQISEELRMNIISEKWKPGTKIPPELELCEIYHVSRITIRKSIEELVKDNLVYRKRAKGTFVAEWEEKLDDHFTFVKSFTTEMKELGKEAVTLKADFNIIKANKKIARYLNVNIGDSIIRLKRVRGTDGEAFVYVVTYITYDERYPTDNESYYGSLYTLLADYGVLVNQETEYVEAILPTKEIQYALNINHYEPILKRVRMTKHIEGSYREYSENFYIGKQYRYYVDM
ncbi:GntR family transcriptional regulator [Marinilactibacillus psychrotolerans]|uniref:GntR family transcriptional regulator n=1 Tax=Marinilactibacillus psychrotolerans TaxID=191770 RepID=A0A5R9C895_9LACT|nr:GntR family transcriptional regulator [Marinilactibacillus psychrotolerans]TLQ09448.1 GntR family transcriptional regulator [Marinilactibacillus psychrotolerans]